MKFDAVALLAVKFSRDKSRWRTIETTYDYYILAALHR